jgi:phosphinothricin acetyltransferase
MEIRPGDDRDLERINDIYNHYVRETAITFDLDEITMDQRREWLTHYATTGRYRLLVGVDDHTVMGYATSSQLQPRRAYETSVAFSIFCDPEATGRGLGSRLYSALIDAMDGEDVHRAYGGITVPNAASFALHERFGFTQVAYFTEQGRKFGRYWDVAWFEKPL